MIRSIKRFDDPILQRPCVTVPFDNALTIGVDLVDTLVNTNDGVGMAAPQIGKTARVVVMRDGLKQKPMIFIDPIITSFKGKQTYNEGCLSYPGVFVMVKRAKFIKVTFNDRTGDLRQLKFRGLEAIIMQHEIDHLNGRCLVGDEWRRSIENPK